MCENKDPVFDQLPSGWILPNDFMQAEAAVIQGYLIYGDSCRERTWPEVASGPSNVSSRLRGLARRLRGSAWRLRGLARRLRGSAWRLRGLARHLRGFAWRLRGFAWRLRGHCRSRPHHHLTCAPSCSSRPHVAYPGRFFNELPWQRASGSTCTISTSRHRAALIGKRHALTQPSLLYCSLSASQSLCNRWHHSHISGGDGTGSCDAERAFSTGSGHSQPGRQSSMRHAICHHHNTSTVSETNKPNQSAVTENTRWAGHWRWRLLCAGHILCCTYSLRLIKCAPLRQCRSHRRDLLS